MTASEKESGHPESSIPGLEADIQLGRYLSWSLRERGSTII